MHHATVYHSAFPHDVTGKAYAVLCASRSTGANVRHGKLYTKRVLVWCHTRERAENIAARINRKAKGM